MKNISTNKHAQNLRAMLAVLPVQVCHVYRDVIYDAAVEIDRLSSELSSRDKPDTPGPGWAGIDMVELEGRN